ncbi:MAG: hypothetical protein GMKNLPBB_00904 [Myxococcota bacterium]|nr:hypothetical protein [Myxococcota bacterium]
MPHVCHITTVHPVFDTRIFVRECCSLAKAGYRVSLVARHDRNETKNGVEIIQLPQPETKIQRRLLWPWLAAKIAARTGADLFHFHDPELMPAMQALSAAVRKPVIWDAHEYYVDVLGDETLYGRGGRVFSRVFNAVETAACRLQFGGVVTVSDDIAEHYRRRGVKVVVAGNYAERSIVADHIAPGHDALVPIFSNSGWLHEDRGLTPVLRAFAQVRKNHPCRLGMWGKFTIPAQEQAARALVDELNLSGPVEIGGPYPREIYLGEKIPSAFASLALFINATENNQLGAANRIFEAWAKGLPLITSEGTNTAKLVRRFHAGLVCDNSAADIARCMEYLLTHRDEARRMGENGRQAVLKEYNWESAFENILSLYDEVLKKK